jgi:DNA repair photolyase
LTKNYFVHFIHEVASWTISPYKNCSFKCAYCISGTQGDSVPWYSKDLLLKRLREALASIPSHIEIGIGGKTDAYPPIEKEKQLMRIFLKEFQAQKRPFCINTKSDLVCRDIDILSKIESHCDVYISICTTDDDAVRTWEPLVPAPSRRIRALKKLLASGIDANVDAAPWIPEVTDAEKLIDILPSHINIQFAPLEIMSASKKIKIYGREYSQEEILDSYFQQRDKIGLSERIIWRE